MTEPRDFENWAAPVETFHVDEALEGLPSGNVEGRRPVGPMQGFGQLWHKTFSVQIEGASPEDVIAVWKEKFGEFWPAHARFFAPHGIHVGEVALIGSAQGPIRMTTGVRVIYADETSWAYMMPEGHPWAAFITFAAIEAPDGVDAVVASVDMMLRTNDPLYELGFKFGGSRAENKVWVHTLTELAKHFGIEDPTICRTVTLVDRKRRWNEFRNIWKNSVVRTLLRIDRR